MLLQADLTDPTSLPATMVGISAIIDCATARPEESTQKVDWQGKVALIQCAQVGGDGGTPKASHCADQQGQAQLGSADPTHSAVWLGISAKYSHWAEPEGRL